MPLRLPAHLPAIALLQEENIFVGEAPGTGHNAVPLRIVILNLMPIKVTTETDFVRVFAGTPFDVEISFMCIKHHTPRHTSAEHMAAFYKDFYAVQAQTFDGMIITGAPVEMLDYAAVTYWQELTEIFRWAQTHVRSTLYLCWAAQAALFAKFGIPKYALAKKCFGAFRQTVLMPSAPIFRGFGETFMMPHSRHTTLHDEDLLQQPALVSLAAGQETGISILYEEQGRAFYVMGHFEYPPRTLDDEYRRDVGKRDDVDTPKNYYEDDNPQKKYVGAWCKDGTRFYNNWLTYYVLNKK